MSRKMFVVVNGYPVSGKDKVVEIVSASLRSRGWDCGSRSSVETPKEITRAQGIPDEPKTPEKRALWSDIKTAFEKYDRFMSRQLMQDANDFFSSFNGNRIFFVHIREPEAIQFMWDILEPGIEWLTIFVERPDAERVTSNLADQLVEGYSYAVRIFNGGTLENLQVVCDQLAQKIHEGNE